MFIGDLATVASAAPTATTPEKRSAVDLAAFNQFRFVNQELQYFNAINAFGLLASEQLAAFNNLSISGFQDTLRQQCLGSISVFDNFDLSTLQLGGLNFDVVDSLNTFDVAFLIDVSLHPQTQVVIQKAQISTVIA
ncbi:hypothetical protein F5B18DRAFT_652722 [Nemania serpens]|nr:hypothetical protein F5B18DRAFT_652722 [Nemania serpens]